MTQPDLTTTEKLTVAAGPNGLSLTPPNGVRLKLTAPLDASPNADARTQLARIESALTAPQDGPPLTQLAKGRRRVAVIVGDMAYPAPYDVALPAIVKALTTADIRPTRISFVATPGNGTPLLGRAAIDRYGEEIVGEHDVVAWQGDAGAPDPLYAAADLKVVIAPRVHQRGAATVLPAGLNADFFVELELCRKVNLEVSAVRAWSGSARTPASKPPAKGTETDVLLVGSGGAPWEVTLEEALLSLHSELSEAHRAQTRTVVLAFGGEAGFGSARFTRDLMDLLKQADELLAQKSEFPQTPLDARYYDPASTLAAALGQYTRVVLFSPEFHAHADGDELSERLQQAPALAERLIVTGAEAELWQRLRAIHGDTYQMLASPLGWREGAEQP